MQFVHEIQRALRVGRTFHIHTNEARRIHRGRLRHEAADDVTRQFLIHIQTHVSQLETDVGIEMVGRDRIENLLVELRTVTSFFGIGDVLAEIIDADGHAGAVDRLRGADCIGDFCARHEPTGKAASNGGTLGKIA